MKRTSWWKLNESTPYLLAARHLKVEPQVLNAQFATVDVVVLHLVKSVNFKEKVDDGGVLHPLLLDGDVGEVNKEVVHLPSTVVVLHRAEPGWANI